MKPVFFPFTFVSSALAEQLQPFFRSLTVYQPIPRRLPEEMRRMQTQGFLEVVAPSSGDDVRLESLARQFRDWGALHGQGVGLRAAGAAGSGCASPTFDEETCAQIVAEVKRRALPTDPASELDPLVPARLFLHLAQEFDRQSLELQSELEGLDRRTAQLFESLKGRASTVEAAPAVRGAGESDAHADYLIANRMSAWSRLFLSRPCPSAVFVTHHAAAVALVVEKMPVARRVLPGQGGFDALEAFCDGRSPTGDLMGELQALVAAPPARVQTVDGGGVQRGVYVLPEVAPQQLWTEFSLGFAPEDSSPAAVPDCRNTLLVVA